jgi:DNA-binding GntR family transcriptional regulator
VATASVRGRIGFCDSADRIKPCFVCIEFASKMKNDNNVAMRTGARTRRKAEASEPASTENRRVKRDEGARPRRNGRTRKPYYLAEAAYHQLRQAIMNGDFQPADHVKEEKLVEILGVSRSVVRQALIQLTAEGLLVDEPKRGKSVAHFTEEKLAKLLPIRICLEQLAVRGAVARITDREAAELRKMAARLKESLMDLEQQAAADIALHRKIWAIAGNDELETLLNRVVGPFLLMAAAVLVSPLYKRNWPAMSWQQVILEREKDAGGHQVLVEAICNRDTPAAVRAMEDHLTVNYSTAPEEFGRKVAELMRKYWI